MKKLLLSLSIVIAAFSLVACSKDKGNNNANNGYNNGYYGQNGQYGATPNDQCLNGGYQGYPYQGYQQGYYPGAHPQQQYRPNCIPQGQIYGGNPYMFQMNFQMYLGTCDMRFAGRGQLCPPGYSCRTQFGPMGVCMRY